MKVFVGFVFLCVLGCGVAQVWPGTPLPVQPEPECNLPVSIEFKDMPLTEALTKMFDSVKVSYSLSPHLKGKVTVSVHNVPFPDALTAVLKAGSASAYLQKGVYYAMPITEYGPPQKLNIPGPDPAGPQGTRLKIGGGPEYSFLVIPQPKVKEMLPDGQFVYAVYDWTVVKLAKRDLRIVAVRELIKPAMPEPNPSGRRVDNVNLQSVDVREALKELFRNSQTSYSIAPDVQGRVSLSGINVPFETALRNILRQVDASYRVEGGVFQVIRTEMAAMYPQPKIGKLAMDGSDLYVSLGLRIVRLSKKDLSIVFERNIAISPSPSEKSGR